MKFNKELIFISVCFLFFPSLLNAGNYTKLKIIDVLEASPVVALSGSEFIFKCLYSGNLPDGYRFYLNFGIEPNKFLREDQPGGHTRMNDDCFYEGIINTVGKRLFRVGIFDENNNLVGSYTDKRVFHVSSHAIHNDPRISIDGKIDRKINLGSSYSITFSVFDEDADLKNMHVMWGDNTKPDIVELSGRSYIKTLTHTYRNAGKYTWLSVVRDHIGAKSIVRGVVLVEKSN